ncbi:MAG TPA: helical backbone metal receptor [Planctomycetota bacterium]|nr:helical backbone metal receptor [Planctomycetota bacterium]
MTNAKRFIVVVALFALGLGISLAIQGGCGSRAARAPERAQAAPPQRIVTMAPSVVELLFAIGAGGRVAGVGDWCFHPPEAKRLPRVGGEYNPSLERMLTLQPDLLIVQGRADKVETFCRHNGIRVLHLNTDTLGTLRSGLHELGRAIGLAAEADRLAARIQMELAAVASRVAGRPRPSVFLCMNHSPGSLRGLSTAHGKSLLSELLDVAGGENVLGDIDLAYPPVSKEQLLQREPEVILDLHPGEELSDGARRQLLADWQAMASLPAVRDGRIYVLTDDSLLVPGPRVPLVARRLAEALHPEAEAE